MPPDVFAVPIFDKWLVYAPLHRVVALVNRAALTEFPEQLCAALAEPPEPEPLLRQGPVNPPFLGLVPTRAPAISLAPTAVLARLRAASRWAWR